jgi:hypothetical protein
LSIGTKAVVKYDFIQPIKRPKTFIILQLSSNYSNIRV